MSRYQFPAQATTDASLLVSGTLADSRLSSNVAFRNAANTFTAKQSFSGTDHVGLCLLSLTTAQYNALTPANGDLFRDSTTDRIDARLSRGTVELVDTAGGQVVAGNLAATTLMVGGASGPLLRNNGGNIEARNNANNAYAPLVGSAIDVTTLQISGAFVGSLVNNSGFARLEAMIAARYNATAGNSIYCTDAAASTTRVGINRGDDGTIIIVGTGSFGWSNPGTDVRVNPVLLGFDRLDANTVEINNGTPGAFRDLSLRSLVATTSIRVGGGTVVANILSATATLDFPSIASNDTHTLTITVTGAVAGDSVFLGVPAGLEAGLIFCASVTAANTVTVRMHNSSSGSVNPASGTFRATVIRF